MDIISAVDVHNLAVSSHVGVIDSAVESIIAVLTVGSVNTFSEAKRARIIGGFKSVVTSGVVGGEDTRSSEFIARVIRTGNIVVAFNWNGDTAAGIRCSPWSAEMGVAQISVESAISIVGGVGALAKRWIANVNGTIELIVAGIVLRLIVALSVVAEVHSTIETIVTSNVSVNARVS